MEQPLRTSLIGITISFSLFTVSAPAQTPSFTAASVLNAASQVAGPIAPGMLVEITGSNFGGPLLYPQCSSSYPVSTTCNGVSVLVNGTAAPVISDSANAITFQVPNNVGGSTANLQVTTSPNGPTLFSAVVPVPAAATAPGLFSGANGTGSYYDSSAGGLLPGTSPPVQVGDTVVLYGTGFGATNPVVTAGNQAPTPAAAVVANVTMTINNQSVPVTSAGLAPGDVGYDQVVFTVPSGLTVPANQTTASFPMVVTVGGVASNAVNLIVAAPLPAITSVTPNPVPVLATPQTVTFNGSAFQNGLTLELQAPNLQVTKIAGANITWISSTQFTAQLTVATAGTWYLLVDNPDGDESSVFAFTVSGAGPVPTITSINVTSSGASQIAQNTWIEIHGSNLSLTTTDWTNWDFADKGLPTTLGGASATVNSKPAVIFYASPTQVNVLTPLDTATGPVPVQVATQYGQMAKQATETQVSPAFLVYSGTTYVAARHYPSFSLLGPAALSVPGSTFAPAKPGELVLLYATGFGQTSPPITDQSKGQGNLLPAVPSVTIGGTPATVVAGLSGPGLYQLNVVVPAGAPNGDLPLTASYNGGSTQTAFITVQQ
jgi:uncharacterized protein (TIGR03437 family)